MRSYSLVLLAAVLGTSISGSDANADGFDPHRLSTYERCRIIAEEQYGDPNRRHMLLEFCDALLDRGRRKESGYEIDAPDNSDAPDAPNYFVKCVVADDPTWIGFRLVTRGQCEEMNGTAK